MTAAKNVREALPQRILDVIERYDGWENLLAFIAKAEKLSATAAGECEWSSDFEGTWSTGCGHLYCINEGTPHENEMAYCCFCGKKTTETNRLAAQESP